MTKKKDNSKEIELCLDLIGEYFTALDVQFEKLDKLVNWDLAKKYNIHKMVAYSRLQKKEARILTEKVSK